MASINHNISINWSGISGGALVEQITLSANSEINVSEPIAASTTNAAVGYACPTASLVSFYMVSDVNLTCKVNSSSSPLITINLVAGVPYLWHNQSGLANPFSADITALFFTNGTVGQANLNIRSLRS